MDSIYWIGPRESDIESSRKLFKGSVTIYGSNSCGNHSYCGKYDRVNHNIENNNIDVFIQDEISKILENEQEAHFLFRER